jgi:ribosomal protein L37AE/L43A
MITEFEVEYRTESGHDYGKYVCPICKEKIKSRLSSSYLSKISSCTKCKRIKVKEKFESENRFLNGKTIPTNCKKCNVELDETNRAKNIEEYKNENI